MSRFDYVKYNADSIEIQEAIKDMVQKAETCVTASHQPARGE